MQQLATSMPFFLQIAGFSGRRDHGRKFTAFCCKLDENERGGREGPGTCSWGLEWDAQGIQAKRHFQSWLHRNQDLQFTKGKLYSGSSIFASYIDMYTPMNQVLRATTAK